MVMCVGSDNFLFLSHPPAPGSKVSEESSDRVFVRRVPGCPCTVGAVSVGGNGGGRPFLHADSELAGESPRG